MDEQLNDMTLRYIEGFYDILDTMIRRMISIEESNSISRMLILQLSTHHDAGIDMANHFLSYTDNEQLRAIALETVSLQTSIVERMARAIERCSIVVDSNSDIVNYERAYNYIIDHMFTNMIDVEVTNDIDSHYIETMISYHRGGLRMARNALRFRLCRELNDILRDVVMIQSRLLEQLTSLSEFVE